jgi:CheY-like chemotaxis protein
VGNALGAQGVAPPEEFTELVRDALLHLYDPAYLQTHPLLTYAGHAEFGAVARGKRLRQALLDAIESLQPGAGGIVPAHAWRTYRILELRYVEGNEVADVIAQIALSKSQYHREHNRALHAVASLLWENWHVVSSESNVASSDDRPHVMTRQEVERLVTEVGSIGAQLLDPVEILRGVERLLRSFCIRHGVDLQLVLPERAPPIRGERVALRQLLLLVLAHAIEATDRGVVTASLSHDQEIIEITITSSSTDLSQPGESLLAEWHPFVGALKGQVIGLTRTADHPRGLIYLSFPASESPTLLVVDNNADFINLIERYLAGSDWKTFGVPSVDEAFAFARQRRPTAILLDIVIPGRDGWDLLVDLKTTPTTRDIPVIVCSVLAEPEIATSLGAATYLQKPITQEAFLRALSVVHPGAVSGSL